MSNLAAKITTRRGLLTVTVITVCTFAASGILGNGHHGLRGTFADIAWFAFLLSALTLVLSRHNGTCPLAHRQRARKQTRFLILT